MPVIQHAMRLISEESATENDVRFALNDRSQKTRILRRIVFQVGVLNDDDVSAGGFKSGANRRSFAPVLLVEDELEFVPRISRRGLLIRLKLLQLVASPVAAAIVNQHDLFAKRHGSHAIDQRSPVILFVVDRDHDRQHPIRWDHEQPQLPTRGFTQRLLQPSEPFGRVRNQRRIRHASSLNVRRSLGLNLESRNRPLNLDFEFHTFTAY